MSLSLTIYGATDCDDTARTRDYLRARKVPFHEINIDHDSAAAQFVVFINQGYRSTPTLVLDEGTRKIIVTEPTDAELDTLLTEQHHLL